MIACANSAAVVVERVAAVILADDNAMLVRSLAKRGYLDVLKRRVPLYRVSALLGK